ncbi:FliM/FliN family flagellar motor switch protein [Komagataeibacter saccharivorans]|uniref:FliM/FliN family flagellar motor switch protein n=1 Tax=Komagataeibacter saccharivorans TaxID=265959 RepID=UPI002155E59E|nr:FliM/FliN family flagellar motor switch protein [Komagataeibacter saccharivorans]
MFEEKIVPLSEILSLQPGKQITFPHQSGTPIHVRLQCGQTPLFEGRLGKLHDKAAVKIEKRLFRPKTRTLMILVVSSPPETAGRKSRLEKSVPFITKRRFMAGPQWETNCRC